MMIALLVIMIALAVNSIFLDGGKEGLKFYLLPDAEKIKEHGLINVIVGAMNQAFFHAEHRYGLYGNLQEATSARTVRFSANP